MRNADPASPFWRLTSISLFAALPFLLFTIREGGIQGISSQLLLTFIGIAAGSFLAAVMLTVMPRFSKMLLLGIVAILLSQTLFLLLVWSGWKVYNLLWRLWWVTMVPTLFLTHLLVLRAGAKRGADRVVKLTSLCVVWAGLMFMGLGFKADVFGDLHPVHLALIVFPAAVSVTGTLFIWTRWLLAHVGAETISKRALIGGMFMTHLLLFVLGFYLGKMLFIPNADRVDRALDNARTVISTNLEGDLYDTQTKVSLLIGDTKVVHRDPFITNELILKAEAMMEPGDIILERLNWKLSNPWLSGFWPHAALYVGNLDDLKELGIADHPAVKAKLAKFTQLDSDGYPHTVIEALGDGVLFNSITESMHADYVAVLRPRLTKEQKAEAIIRAFKNHGRDYDFNFDFDDLERLVCTQVVYLSYEDTLDIDLVRIMGRNTLPALEFANKFAGEREQADRELDFVLFLDAQPEKGTAYFSDEQTFLESIERPRFLVE